VRIPCPEDDVLYAEGYKRDRVRPATQWPFAGGLMPASTDWNSLVHVSNRFVSPNRNARKPAHAIPTHIVIHVTGTDDAASVKKLFMSKDSVSAHYLVLKDGAIAQFVPDAFRAYHAGIESNARVLYRKGAAVWMRYLKYFSWYTGYPSNAVYLDGDLKPVWDKTEAVFVARQNGQAWPHYQYFSQRWPGLDAPVHFGIDADPNNYAIGIETLGVGSKSANPAVYTPAMYKSLRTLVRDLSERYGIPMEKGRIVAHEDVNPIARFGWDPGAGFDWSRVHA
jgi:hypothetical protein